jgi:tungstate transport system permease protein
MSGSPVNDFTTQVLPIVWLSLKVSGLALLFSGIVGVPLGAWIGLTPFRGRWFVMVLLNTLTGLPPVLVGLVVYLVLSRSGPLGELGWLFTPKAMVLAQTILALPLIAAFTAGSVMGVDPDLPEQLAALGATRAQVIRATLDESRIGLLIAVAAGFGSIISEVGAVMMVGGNIENHTRVLTTAILLETRQGNFQLAGVLGIVLLGVSLAVNLLVLSMQPRTAWR